MMNIQIKFSVSDSAISELKKAIEPQQAIRISSQSSGCSGVSYDLGITDKEDIDPASDIVEEINGVTFVSDRQSAMRLDGVLLEWHSDDEREGFKFNVSKPSTCCRKGGCA
jgi:iron-sulfur cluster assembly accessory protein